MDEFELIFNETKRKYIDVIRELDTARSLSTKKKTDYFLGNLENIRGT